MTHYVVDASVVVKTLLPEAGTESALKVIAGKVPLVAPDLLWSEVANVLWKRQRRGEITAGEASAMLHDALRDSRIQIVSSVPLLLDAFSIAAEGDRAVYDAVYVALAVQLECEFITADKRLVNALARTPWLRHLRTLMDV